MKRTAQSISLLLASVPLLFTHHLFALDGSFASSAPLPHSESASFPSSDTTESLFDTSIIDLQLAHRNTSITTPAHAAHAASSLMYLQADQQAEESKPIRAKQGEFFVFGQIVDDSEVDWSTWDLAADIDGFGSGGLGMAANLNEYLNLNWEFFFGKTDVVGKDMLSGQEVKIDSNVWGMNINLDWNILKYPITPVASGGLGVMGWSNNDFRERNFSYNLGGGVRWDINDELFLKAIYRRLWTELQDADDESTFDIMSLYVGVKY